MVVLICQHCNPGVAPWGWKEVRVFYLLSISPRMLHSFICVCKWAVLFSSFPFASPDSIFIQSSFPKPAQNDDRDDQSVWG